ncbi:hypothetical protein [Thalassotalea sp. PLHSN55]|uniref:hypothetical protein n=1 Tax=Thalassotalea sp. PLHSN55 TaxID=3435888 RepID=UPI003F85FA76
MNEVSVFDGGGNNAAGAAGIRVINEKKRFLSLDISGIYLVTNKISPPDSDVDLVIGSGSTMQAYYLA